MQVVSMEQGHQVQSKDLMNETRPAEDTSVVHLDRDPECRAKTPKTMAISSEETPLVMFDLSLDSPSGPAAGLIRRQDDLAEQIDLDLGDLGLREEKANESPSKTIHHERHNDSSATIDITFDDFDVDDNSAVVKEVSPMARRVERAFPKVDYDFAEENSAKMKDISAATTLVESAPRSKVESGFDDDIELFINDSEDEGDHGSNPRRQEDASLVKPLDVGFTEPADVSFKNPNLSEDGVGGGDWGSLNRASDLLLSQKDPVELDQRPSEFKYFSKEIDDMQDLTLEFREEEHSKIVPNTTKTSQKKNETSHDTGPALLDPSKTKRNFILDDTLSDSESGDEGQLAAGRRANDLALLRKNLAGQTAHGNCAAAFAGSTETVTNPVGFSPFANTAAPKKQQPSKGDGIGDSLASDTAGGLLAEMMNEAVLAQEASQHTNQPSPRPNVSSQQERQASPPSASPEQMQVNKSELEPQRMVEVHSPPVAAAPSTTVNTRIESPQKAVNTIAESPPQKRSMLELMMAESVEVHEAMEPNHGNMEKRGLKEEPEVVGLDISFDPHEDARRRGAHHAAVSTQDKQRKNFLAKTDAINDALKNSVKEEDDGRDALSFMARKPQATQGDHFADTHRIHANGADSVLSGLRKNYHAEADSSQYPGSRNTKPPEETAEEDGIGDEVENWDVVEAQTKKMAEDALAQRGVVAKVEDASLQLITNYKEIQDWLNTLHVDPEVLRPFNEEDDDGKVAGCGCGPRRRRLKGDIPYLNKSRFGQEKDFVLFLTKTDFDFNVMNHFRMLRTTFIKLTRSKSCPSIGGHWEVIGFQGGDPRTDINRSGGVFNVLQLFFFLMHNFDILKACWLLSQDHEQHFPMAAVSINITQMVVEAFLAGALSSVCNKGGRLFETLCRIHNAGLFYFYSQWRHQKRTITDTDLTKREIRTLLMKKPAKLLEELDRGVEDDRRRQDPSKLAFTNLDFGTTGGAESSQAHQKAAPKRAPVNVPARLRNYSAPDDQ